MLPGFVKKYILLLLIACTITVTPYHSVSATTDPQGNPFAVLTGGDTLRLSLQDAILMSLERNPSIQLQRLQPLVAKTWAMQQSSPYDPVLAASANRVKSKTQRFLGAQRTPYEFTSERTDYAASLSQNLPIGTNITASFLETSNISSIYTDQFTGSMKLTITQSLLQGLGLGSNLASLRQARLDVQISQAEFKAVAEQAVANMENAYWTLALAAQENAIQQQSLTLALKQLSESQERVAVGKLPVLELAAVHAEVATRKEALIDAQSRYEQARLRFIYLVTPEAANAWTITPQPIDRPFVPADTLDDVSLHVQAGMQYRPDLLQAQYNLKKGAIELSRTRNGILPKLDFFISFGRSAYAESFKSSLPDKHSPYYESSAGLSFEFPVLKLNDRAQLQRAHYTKEQLQLALDNMKLMVELDVRAAYVEVVRSRQQIGATIITRELQEKKLDAELEKFRVGKSTNYLVLQAQRELTSSQLDEARAQVAYLNALVSLYQMEGTLLERRNLNY
ncbi:MAG TPA: TolC family protein [bacterium]|nr:TolC family protein [bacterium]HPN43919.1 TolC family protein [bacterium]